jgi:hypothetical protein
LIRIVVGLQQICDNEEPDDAEERADLKDLIYNDLQKVRMHRESIHSTDVPKELYFFLEDIKSDLDIELDIGLAAGSNILIYKLSNRYKIVQTIFLVYVQEDESELPSSRIIEFPRIELRRPLSYPILVHECFHTKTELVQEVEREVLKHNLDISADEIEEVCVDLLSLNYMGPVYGQMLMQIPDKIGKHEPSEHLSPATRLKYILQYIDTITEESSSIDNDVQRT